MITANFEGYASYTVDSLYQWDIDRTLEIVGLSLNKSPEIHFTNNIIKGAIVRSTEASGSAYKVKIPNSLLQYPSDILAFVVVDNQTVEEVRIPIIERQRPVDYQIQDSDEEIYSFKALEKMVKETVFNNDTFLASVEASNQALRSSVNSTCNTTVANVNAKCNATVNEVNTKCDETISEVNETVEDGINQANSKVDSAIDSMTTTVEETTAELSARLDNVIAHNNDTEGNTELIDIRVDRNGTSYASAGEHVRKIEEDVASLTINGGALSKSAVMLLIQILKSVGQYTDEDILTKITALSVALRHKGGTGGTGGGETGGDEDIDVGSLELLTDGLQAFFDFRNVEPIINSSAGSTIINASKGSGAFSAWSASTILNTDDHGSEISRSMVFSDQNNSMNQSNCGDEFTWFIKFYSCNFGVIYPADYALFSNITLLSYRPKYNTSSGTAQVTPEDLGSREIDNYIDIAITVNKNICKLYINGSLVKTSDGNNISDFVSWFNMLKIDRNNNAKITCIGVWNKALDDAEITYTNLYGKSLEVV